MRGESEITQILKQELEALETNSSFFLDKTAKEKRAFAITALRTALAEGAMQRLTDVQQEIEKTHASVDNEYTPVKSWAWNEYPIDTDTTRGPMLMTVGDTLSRAGFIKKQKPLSDEHLTALCRQHWDRQANILDHIAYARAIERAHGIGGGE